MKRFIVISLLLSVVSYQLSTALSCAWIETHNYYLFSVCGQQEFSERVDKVTKDNWRAYLGSEEEYYWFSADKIIEFAQGKGDVLMVSYVKNLEKYIECANAKQQEHWSYPTKQELQQRRQTLSTVRTYAQGKLKTRLRSQHALLFMRCNMMLGRHQENVTFWEQTASQYINSVYKEMMENIYAGALLKTGHTEQAVRLFAEQGDWNSLMTIYYKKRSFADIRAEYLRNPNSPVLPFLLQDFVNNAQEAVDAAAERFPDGKLFIRNIEQQEARQMCQLADQVVREGKSESPVLWMGAKAWLEYMFGQERQGLADAEKAVTMDGAERHKDNARVLLLYIKSAQSKLDDSFDNYLAQELEWLDSQKADDHYVRVLDRLVHQVLADKYARADRQQTSLALYRTANSYAYEAMLDTMAVTQLQHYMDYVAQPATTALDRFLKPHQKIDRIEMDDLMGTKYMRLCQWQEAIKWLSRVPLSFYQERGYAVYAAYRNYNVEPWKTRQWLPERMEYGDEKKTLTKSPKFDFCQEMLEMEAGLSVLGGTVSDKYCQRCYDLAVRYAQAHFTGDCWYLMRDGKSVSDTLRVNEVDLAAKAVSYLQEASRSAQFLLREKALFAMSYGALYTQPWRESVWDETATDWVMRTNTSSPNYKALSALYRFEQANAQYTSDYVSRCDEFIQFKKLPQ